MDWAQVHRVLASRHQIGGRSNADAGSIPKAAGNALAHPCQPAGARTPAPHPAGRRAAAPHAHRRRRFGAQGLGTPRAAQTACPGRRHQGHAQPGRHQAQHGRQLHAGGLRHRAQSRCTQHCTMCSVWLDESGAASRRSAAQVLQGQCLALPWVAGGKAATTGSGHSSAHASWSLLGWPRRCPHRCVFVARGRLLQRRLHLVQHHIHARMALPVARQRRRKRPEEMRARQSTSMRPACPGRWQRSATCRRAVSSRSSTARIHQIGLACQRHGAPRADWCARTARAPSFVPAGRSADQRRLRDMQALRSACEAQLFRQGDEVTQMAQFH